MSMMPPPSPGSAPFAGGYSPGPLPGLPTSAEDAYPAGTIDSRARNSLVLGILAIPLSILAGVPAIVVGLHALRRIAASEGALRGRGVARAGVTLGCLSVVVAVIALVLVYA